MKAHFYLLICCHLLITLAQAQNVGIGESSPLLKLHVTSGDSALALFKNTQSLDVNVKSAIYFQTGSWYTGAIKTIGGGTNVARLGLFTYAAMNANNLFERMSILDNGDVGIGTINPTSLLHINGALTISDGSQGINKVLVSDAAGLASWKSSGLKSGFKASNGSTQTIIGGATAAVSFPTIEYNDVLAFSSSQFITPENGVYHFDALITWDFNSSPLASNSSFALKIKRGGALYHEIWASLLASTTGPYSQTLNCDMKLTTGDIISIEAYNGSGTSKDLYRDVGTTKYVSFSGHRLY